MIVRLKLFAVASQLAGANEIEIDLPEQATVGDVREQFVEKVPALASIADHLLFAVNNEYAPVDQVVPPGAEVACIPPVSGG
jgi:molybdopterin converting factor subunit 1